MLNTVPPTAPRQVNTSERLATSVRVSWSTPQYTNGTLSQHSVQCSHTEGIYQSISQTSLSGLTHLTTLSGLNPHESYTCCVSATNSAGTGAEGCGDVFWTTAAQPYCEFMKVQRVKVCEDGVCKCLLEE